MLARKPRLLLGLTAATPLLFAACTDNGILNPMADAVGSYRLTVYAGRGMPATFQIQPGNPGFPEAPSGGTFVVTSGSLVLTSNGAFFEANNSVTPVGQASQTSSFSSSGTWTLSGTTFTLSDPSQQRTVSGTLAADVNGNLTVNYMEDSGTGVLQSYEYKR